MGNPYVKAQIPFTDEQAQEYVEHSQLDTDIIRRLHRRFHSIKYGEHKSLSKKDFQSGMNLDYIPKVYRKFLEELFLDKPPRHKLFFCDFLCNVNIFFQLTWDGLTKRIRFVFRMMDGDKDGRITLAEYAEVSKGFIFGICHKYDDVRETLEGMISDENPLISFRSFRQATMRNRTLSWDAKLQLFTVPLNYDPIDVDSSTDTDSTPDYLLFDSSADPLEFEDDLVYLLEKSSS